MIMMMLLFDRMHSTRKPVSTLRCTLLFIVLSLSPKPISASEDTSPSYPELYEWEDESYLAKINDEECPQESDRHKRTAVMEDDNLWPNATIPYVLTDPVHSDSFFREAILESIDHWHERTCIKFVRHENTEQERSALEKRGRYVEFVRGTGCHSSVGRRADTGSQNVSIAYDCAFREMIIHELGHLVGLWHEHARYDRDAHVIILWNNVKEKVQHNFNKQKSMRLLAPYDLSSIMHYNLKTFSGTGENVMKPILEDLQFLVGYRRDLSFYDGYTVNALYKCSAQCGHGTPKCVNDGYLNKDCECVCPRHLTGPTCDQVLTDSGCGGVLDVGKQKLNIKSPNYPKNYPEVTDCTWLLKSAPGTVILLYFEDLDLERTQGGTCMNSLEVRYHYIGIDQGPIVCGNLTNLKSKEYQSTSNRMIIRFHSNSGSESGRGFNLIAKVLPKQNCASGPCLNGAECREIPETDSYFCDCPGGWLGQNCHIEIVDGHWAEWSAWSGCTAQCGREHRVRHCKKPANGGSECFGQTGQSRRCSRHAGLCNGHFYCDFGTSLVPDDCGMIQANSSTDRLDWIAQMGATNSINTGPRTGHSTGELDDVYYYIEASYGQPYDNAILWLPDNKWSIGRYCLQFHYHMYGQSMGQLRVLRRTRNSSVAIWQESGCHGNRWNQANINIILYNGVRIGFEGIRGDAFESDIAIDDISISPGGCVDEELNDEPSSPPASTRTPNGKRLAVAARRRRGHVCYHNGVRHRVGKFSYIDRCKRVSCFCNQNGMVDCPAWKIESICDDQNKLDRNDRSR